MDALLRLAEVEKQRMEEEVQPSLFPREEPVDLVLRARKQREQDKPLPVKDLRKLKEVQRLTMGFHEVFGAMYTQMGFDKVFGSRKKMAARLCRQAVLMRLAKPGGSKRKHCRALSRDHGIEVHVDKFYRMMDALDEDCIARLQSIVSDEVLGLMGGALDVLFFDATTLSFASEKEDALRRFSKDGKPHRVQVVLALLQTKQGLPVGYELYPGNTADVSTLEAAIVSLRARIKIERVIFVADSGMLSNMALLTKRGFDYVVAARLRKLPKFEALLENRAWMDAGSDARITEVGLQGRRLVLRHSGKKAAKDAHDRDKAIERLTKRLAAGIKGKGRSGRFIKVNQDALSLDEAAIARDKVFDGLHGVWTSLSAEHLPARHVYRHYRELWRIEEGFRVMKHTMAIRPIFHWTEHRVRAPIAICFVAFALLRILRHKHNSMHGGHEPQSEERILSELRRVETSVICDQATGKKYLLASTGTPEQRSLYAAAGQKLAQRTVLLS